MLQSRDRWPALGADGSFGPLVMADAREAGARVVSVYGPSRDRVLVDMPRDLAQELFPDGLEGAAYALASDGVVQDIASLATRDSELATSGLAGAARQLALQIDHPYTSATSKAMCAKAFADALRELREMAPPERPKGPLDDIRAERSDRLSEG